MVPTPATADERRALEVQLAPVLALGQLQQRLAKVERERDEYRNLVRHLKEENERLKRGLLGQKAERLPRNDAQLTLAILEMALGSQGPEAPDPEPESTQEHPVKGHQRKAPARKPLPEHLPRVPLVLLPPEVEREGTDAFEYIGSEFREVLERRPASTVVVRLEYKKFVRKSAPAASPAVPAASPAVPAASPAAPAVPAAPTVLVAETVELPIVRGTAGPGFLADTIVRRWQDHQPLHRLEGIYARDGLSLARSTLCTWHEQLAQLARPLVEAMFQDARGAPYLCVDATGVLVLDKERCRQGHFWVLVVPQRHVLYRYSRRHTKEAVDQLLGGYQGYLVADAHVVYDHLFQDGAVIEVACWAHARRYFFKALGTDPDRAKVALGLIAALFRIERDVAKVPRAQREQARQERSKPLVERFFWWCDAEAPCVLDESPMATALGYARNQRGALQRFLEDGRLPLHNNSSELNLRRQVLGRRNWLFCGSEEGAEVNTVFVSLLASCRLHQVEPLGYLRDLFCLLPRWPLHRILDLAPVHWSQTSQEPQTQQLLAANPFRRVALGSLS